MSTASSPPPATVHPGLPTALAHGPRREIKLTSHSQLFYWWPIWALGFLLAALTHFEDHRLAIVPGSAKVIGLDPTSDGLNYKITVPAGDRTKSLDDAAAQPGDQAAFRPRVSQRAWLGPVFCFTLLLTIVITSVAMRGLWSFVVIGLLVVVAMLFSLLNVWGEILLALDNLHIYINMAGYLFIGVPLFVIWAVSVFLVDHRTYAIFTPGQVQVCEHIGDSIRTYDTTGMTFEKQRDDLFRHIILGFGSGDLIIRTAGAERQEIKLTNVLGVSWKLETVQDMLREKQVSGL